MIGKYLVNEQYILETSHWLITSRNEHKMTVNFINSGSAVEVKPDGILVWPLGSNQMESWFGRWGQTRWNPGLAVGVRKGLKLNFEKNNLRYCYFGIKNRFFH